MDIGLTGLGGRIGEPADAKAGRDIDCHFEVGDVFKEIDERIKTKWMIKRMELRDLVGRE